MPRILAVSKTEDDFSKIGTPTRSFHKTAKSDVAALNMDRIINEGKQDEMDDVIGSMSAIAEVLESGKEEDIVLVLFETQQILANCREFAIQVLVPIICKNVLKWSYSLKLSAGETLRAVLRGDIPKDIAKQLSKIAFSVLNQPCDASMCEGWGEILVVTLPHVVWTVDKLDEVINLLENQQGGSENPMSRQLTARILGSLASYTSDGDLKRRILGRAIPITQDNNPDVRGMITESLSLIGASMNVSIVETELWPCLVRLLNDNDARIHAASLRTVSYIAAAHRGKSGKSTLFKDLVPSVFSRECKRIRSDAALDQRNVDDDKGLVLEISSEIFGELLYSSHEHFLDDAGRREAYKAFMAMATSNGPVVRKYCAYNIPAVSLCLSGKYAIELSALVEFLARDSDDETRWMLAAGIHQTVKLLARNTTMTKLFEAVHSLLKDSTSIVRLKTIEHFQELIAELSKHSGYSSAQKLTPLFENLHLLADGNWRTQELLAKQLTLAVPLVPPPSLKMDVLPLLYRMTEEGSYLVRKAAMAAVATCIRYIPDITTRDTVMEEFRQDWGRASVFWMRVAFIDAAVVAVGIYSRCLFRDTFGLEVLRLSNDLVANVRLRIAFLLPRIASACILMEGFHLALENLKKDEDPDVRNALVNVDCEIRQAMERRNAIFEEDMKLEEEEQELHSQHLQRQLSFQRKKNAEKRRPSVFLGKAAKGIQASTSRALERDLDESGEDTQRPGQPGRSFKKSESSPRGMKMCDSRSPSSRPSEATVKSEKKKNRLTPRKIGPASSFESGAGFSLRPPRSPRSSNENYSSNEKAGQKKSKATSPKKLGASIYGEGGGRIGSRSFKGLVPLLSPRASSLPNRKSKSRTSTS